VVDTPQHIVGNEDPVVVDVLGGVHVTKGRFPAIEMRGVGMSFPGVVALKNVDFSVMPGEVHALVGENGAGKSTMMKVLSGLNPGYTGEVLSSGRAVDLSSPKVATEEGIVLIHQELSYIPDLSVADNINLGREPALGRGFWLDRHGAFEQAKTTLERFNAGIDPKAPMRRLTPAERQLVEICKGVSRDPRVLILDEPTSSLSDRESHDLLDRLRALRQSGVGIIYISHHLEEVLSIATRVTVLRDGERVATRKVAEWSHDTLVRAMVGRELAMLERRPATRRADGPPALSVRGMTIPGAISDVSIDVAKGEILGLAGLIGAGRSDLARGIFGLRQVASGRVEVAGRSIRLGNPRHAMEAGLAIVTEDRRSDGFCPDLSVRENTSLPSISALARGGLVDMPAERGLVARMSAAVGLRAAGPEVEVRLLSGGNQQKVVIGKWLARNPSVLILDEPTRGIDIGAKAEVYEIVRGLADDGMAVLLISSDMLELLSLSDRIAVMCAGRITAEFHGATATEEAIMAAAVQFTAIPEAS
jgi:ribose transport system ATP-binding protein